jgi:hypothetical protein
MATTAELLAATDEAVLACLKAHRYKTGKIDPTRIRLAEALSRCHLQLST